MIIDLEILANRKMIKVRFEAIFKIQKIKLQKSRYQSFEITPMQLN